MLSYLLRQLTNSFGIFFRTIRAFFTRKLVGVWSYLRRITNFSRQATKVASASLQGAAAAVKKPTRREDYIETRRLFISKSFLILLAIGVVLLALLIYFVIWPFLLRTFFTARLWQDDPELETWSGRVVIYYDEAKKNPRYSGTLQDGLLQGRGTEYDEDGLLVYEGNFVDGLYDGTGSRYEAGVLVYQGDFSAGTANGMGTAYSDGVMCYEGAFVNGLYEGEGTEYSADGSVRYKGSFSAGVYEGVGTAYYSSGTRAYVGNFSGGLYEGEGTEYNADGSVRYKGSFAGGLYDGTGTRYLDNGDQIQAEFTAGAANGAIQWYRSGKLWYDGGADDLTPDGFGTLYAESGDPVYAGEFDQGTLDGAWLLTLTAEELRAAFGEASLTETDQGTGFVIVNEALGLTALCSYQQGETEAQVYRLWFAPEAGSAAETLLPWSDLAEARDWAAAEREPEPTAASFQGAAYRPDGTVGGDWYQSQYRYEDYVCTLLSTEEGAAPAELYWSRDMTLPGGDGTSVDSSVSQAQERLDALLSALEGAGSSGAGSGGTVQQGDVERLLGLMLTADSGQELVDALTDYYVYGQMLTALEGSQPLLQQNLAEAQTQLSRGSGTQTAVDSAQSELDSLDRRLAQYETAREQALLTIQELCKLSPDDYDLAAVLLTFDPVELDAAALYEAARLYAVSVAAGRYEVDTDALQRQITSAVLDLSMAYESIRSAQTEVEQAAADVEAQTQAYARGTADKASLYAAQCAQNEAVAALYQAVGEFTRQANALNTLSGGWIAGEYDWMADTFAALFQSEILRGEAAAQEAEEDRAQREEEAAQAIQEEAQATASSAPSAAPAPEETPAAGEAADDSYTLVGGA